jgi:ribosomal-protein-alanine N-acetyltransferase
LAKRLIAHLLDRLAERGAACLFIEVAAGNAPAQALYRSLGFEPAGARRAYYQAADGSAEDALVMRRPIAR